MNAPPQTHPLPTTLEECARDLRKRAIHRFGVAEQYDQTRNTEMAAFYRDHARELLAEAGRLEMTYPLGYRLVSASSA